MHRDLLSSSDQFELHAKADSTPGHYQRRTYLLILIGGSESFLNVQPREDLNESVYVQEAGRDSRSVNFLHGFQIRERLGSRKRHMPPSREFLECGIGL